ncbi:hypothetical protein CAFEA_00240 [Corynebacterium afermentans subsp. afermentans]|uniref:Uncharacterized protein n=1 Tax=Corynebacterium afermentans TaxID=38286 RepID=A0A9X8R6R3_9CORY|nr:hypothetical protein CAFEA_00240 [Corynebacterium afermentans subsp. afermentans]SIQ73502.1 hypothetical protein SAMN05421802_12814 [Corynebacterium afermentans]
MDLSVPVVCVAFCLIKDTNKIILRRRLSVGAAHLKTTGDGGHNYCTSKC